MKPGGVSRRTDAIYKQFYSERVVQRLENLYIVFDAMAQQIDAANLGAKIEIDYECLAEVVRSYFLDIIRYKEYHFDPKLESSHTKHHLGVETPESLQEADPLSPRWAAALHESTRP